MDKAKAQRKIKKLIELVEESGISELEVSSGDESIRIARPAPRSGSLRGEPEQQPAAVASGTGSTLKAPLAGVFYAAPEPGAEPFVGVGQEVAAGDVLCIIESMKMMNEIRADRSGTVAEVMGRNGEPVAKGDPLFRIG